MSGIRNGRTTRVRAALANGPLTSQQIAAALGDFSPQLNRGLWQMKKQGYLTLDDGLYALTDKPVPVVYASDEQRAEAKRATRRRWTQRQAGERPVKPPREAAAPKVVAPKLPRIPKPKPIRAERVVIKPRRKIEDAAFVPASIKLAPVEKLVLPDSSAWMAANPDKVLHLKHGEISRRETLSASDRASIRSVR